MVPIFDVAIAGLGAMGSAAAWNLARRGCRVVGFDRLTPPHDFGSSHGHTRIIREAYFEDPLYVPLVQRAYQLWDALQMQCGRELLRSTGGLMIGPAEGVLVRGARQSAIEHGLAHEVLSASEIARRFPALRPPDGMTGIWEPRAGVLFPEACIDSHLALARAHGAALRFDEPVRSWNADGDGVRIVTDRGEYLASQLLLAAGAWIRALAPDLAQSFWIERQVVCWFDPAANHESFGPSRCPIHLWETAPDEFFYGFPDFGEGIKVALHHGGEAIDPEAPRVGPSDAEISRLRDYVRRFMSDADGALRATAVCMYTNTADGHFWIDRHPRFPQVLVASACSGHGFKFAPVIGEAVAEWLIDGRASTDLSRFARR